MKICCFGSLNIDMVFSVDEFVRPKETIQSKGLSIYAGGKGLNQAMAIQKSGVSVEMAGSVGHDGTLLLEECDRNHLDRSKIRTIDTPTGTAVIQVNQSGENCIILYDGANKQNDIPFMDEVLTELQSGDILVLQNEINDLEHLMKAAKQRGIRIFMNPSPIDEALRKLPLGLCEYLIVNEVEGSILSGQSDPQDIIEGLNQKYPDTKIILTLGGDGVRYNTTEGIRQQAAYHVKAIDTTGAGDAFTGYFIGMTAKGYNIDEAIDFAQKAAAISVTRKGASQSIPFLDEVLAFELI